MEEVVAVAVQNKDNNTVFSSLPASYRILTYGYDAVLLDTRRLLLNQAGYDVKVVANPLEFDAALQDSGSSFELLILCHTVPDHEQETISTAAAQAKTKVFQVPELIPPTDFLARIAAAQLASGELV